MKRAKVIKNDGTFYVVFGHDYKGELLVTHGKSYRTEKGANKAKADHEAKK